MFAVIMKGSFDIRYGDVPEPALQPGGAIVRVDASGICGSDMHAFHGHGRLDRFIRWAYEHVRLHEEDIRKVLKNSA